jgi:hypothetical protein
MAEGPDDPDYRTAWPVGAFRGVRVHDEVIEVDVTGDVSILDLGSQEEVELAYQQLVYTLDAVTGKDLPVSLVQSGEKVTSLPLQRWPQNDALALVSIRDPAEGTHVSGSFMARGRANSFEATVPWQIRRGTDEVVAQGSAMATSGAGDRLYPWQTRIDVSDLEPGTYTFVAMTDDPTGGEGPGPFTDTRTIIVE